MYKILTLNFGGTSAKLALYEDETCLHDYSLEYSKEETDRSCTSAQEIAIKKKHVLDWLDSQGQMNYTAAYLVRKGAEDVVTQLQSEMGVLVDGVLSWFDPGAGEYGLYGQNAWATPQWADLDRDGTEELLITR